jgi:hypothetical protein
LRSIHRRSVKACLALALLPWLLLAIGKQAAAISKLAVPELDEQDLPFYLDKPAQHDDAHFYLFSSLSLISRRRAAAVFELSEGPTGGIIPLLGLKIHLPVDVSFPTEFLDVTIWGQLGNLFQKDLELFAIEREIVALFKELEQVNARYMALFGAQGGNSFQARKPPTLDRRNYLADGRQGGRAGQLPQTGQNTKAAQGFLRLIQLHENPGQSERLAPQLVAQAGADRTPTFEAIALAAASMRASEAQQDPEGIDTIPEGRIIYLFRVSKLVIRYLLENKIEAIIYLWVLMLISLSVKIVFSRS